MKIYHKNFALNMIPNKFIKYIENNYYAKINDACLLEKIIQDKHFFMSKNINKHLAFYTDHGVIHVRNVASSSISLCETFNQLGYYKKNAESMLFIKNYTVLLAYLHDAGMREMTDFGRAVHAEYMMHEVFKEHFDPLINLLLSENTAGISEKIKNLVTNKVLSVDKNIMMREMLAMACCHSKTAVPHKILNSPKKLYLLMRKNLYLTLQEIYLNKMYIKVKDPIEKNNYLKQIQQYKKKQKVNPDIERFYNDYQKEAFSWLLNENPEVQQLVTDVIDSIRVLRAADSLRQRGTVLKTSGNYQILVDQYTANVIYVLSFKKGRSYLLEMDMPLNAGEANLSYSDFTDQGDLLYSFFNGQFGSPVAQAKAEMQAAMVVEDIQNDAIGSLGLPKHRIKILIEQPKDNPDFAQNVATNLLQSKKKLYGKIEIIPSLADCSTAEANRYLAGKKTDKWTLNHKNKVLSKIKQSGYCIDSIDIHHAFEFVREVSLEAGDIVFENKSGCQFAYVPYNSGLIGHAIGGYGEFKLSPWHLFGHISLIRNAERNADVYALKRVKALMIPRVTFLKHWHIVYSISDFKKIMDSFTDL